MKFDQYHIKQLNQDHIHPFFKFIQKNKKHIAPYFPKTMVATESLEKTINYVDERIKLATEKSFFTFVLQPVNQPEIIACFIIKEIDWKVEKGEIGFFIDQDFQGKGITTKGISHIIEFGFETLKLNRLYMRIAVDNIGSRRVAEKNGFAMEGILRSDYRTYLGEIIDLVYYGRLRS